MAIRLTYILANKELIGYNKGKAFMAVLRDGDWVAEPQVVTGKTLTEYIDKLSGVKIPKSKVNPAVLACLDGADWDATASEPTSSDVSEPDPINCPVDPDLGHCTRMLLKTKNKDGKVTSEKELPCPEGFGRWCLTEFDKCTGGTNLIIKNKFVVYLMKGGTLEYTPIPD